MADPKIKYDIEAAVSGEADINNLAHRLEELGRTLGGELGPAAAAAAAEMRALGQQQAAIVAFAKLSEQVKNSERELALAQRSAKSFVSEITAAGPPTAQQAATLGRLNEQVQTSQTRLDGQKTALHGANQELLKYGLTGDRLIEAQRQTAASVDALKTSVQASIPAFKAAGHEGVASARQIQDAWGTLGGKSFTHVQAEITKVKAALETVKASSKSPLEISIATAAAQARLKQLEGGIESVGTVTNGVSGMLRQLGPLMAATFSAQQFVGAITSAESLSRSYEQVFGSTVKARQEMEFIKLTANRLGLETLDLAKSYQSLSASTKGTVLEGKATRDVFEAVARAMSTLGKSSAETDRALTAISQIASKGTASMEELRGQLGEALPGAMKAAADGAGLTVEQLVEMVSSGSVLAQDILPALTKGLNDLYGKAAPPATVISEWARFKNVMTETAVIIGESGASSAIAKGLSGAGTAAQYATANFDILAAMLADLGVAMVRGSTEVNTSTEVIEKYRLKLGITADAANQAAAAQTGLSVAQGAAGVSAQEAFRAQELLAQKTQATGASLLKVKQQYLELSKESAAHVAQVEKEVAARTAESAILTQLVNVYGTELEKRQVAVGVAQEQLVVSEKLASARNVEALIAASYVIKLKEMALANGDVTEATKKQIDEAQKSAAAKQTEFERTDALAKAKRIEAEASKAQAQATQDNSSRVYEYRAAMAEAARELERITELHRKGQATEEQVTNGRAKLAAATLLLRDALSDATKKAEDNVAVQQRAGQLAQASISVDMERAKAALEVASAQGDVKRATELSNEVTNLQVQASQAQADAARNEAKAIREAATAREAELKGRGELTEAAKLEIAARRQTADLKDIEAEKADILTEKILALARANDVETASLEAKNSALERIIAAQEKEVQLAERKKALEDKKNRVDSEGFQLDNSGKRMQVNTPTERSIFEQAKSQGLTEAQALQLAREFLPTANQRGGIGRLSGENWGTDLQKAIDRLVLQNAADKAGTDTRGAPKQTPAGATPAKNYTVTINTGTGPITASFDSDSQAQAFIKVLQGSKASAGY